MLPYDIETEDALAHLSSPALHSKRGVSRRRFLQTAALAGGSAAALGYLPGRDAWATAPIGPNDGVLVLVMLPGGNDGFNMVVPVENGVYYAKRGPVAIAATEALSLGAGFGLHPNMPNIHNLFGQGQVAIVNGVGYDHYTRSHFDSMDIWMKGWAGSGTVDTGWIGRWVDGIGGADDVFQSVSFGNSIPLHLRGAKRSATTLSTNQDQFGGGSDPNDLRLYNAIHAFATGDSGYGALGNALAAAEWSHVNAAQTISPVYKQKITGADLVRQLVLAARIISLNLGLRVITVEMGGFDTHSTQRKQQDKQLKTLDDAVQAFWAALDASFATRVTMMTFSEFGRELLANDSGGTDHGTASAMLVIGPQVRGGFQGQLPALGAPDKYGMVQFNTDFRSVYATVLERWLGGDSNQILGKQFEELALFKSGPGSTPVTAGGDSAPTYPPSAPGDYVPVSPYRVVDTRIGLGGTTALGDDGVLTVKISGVGSVPPTDVTAVALNVTAVDTTAAGFVTVFPAGEQMPLASNLNFVAGTTIPNLTIAKLNASGEVSFYNHVGQTHLVVDVVGYFTQKSGARFVTLSPSRVIDTRTNKAPVVAGKDLTLPVAGVGDVPKDGVAAVLVNMTVTEPTNAGHLTVWPTGEAMPTASSLNFVANETIPNLVISKVGAGGAINVSNHAGAAHVVADVVGYFTPAATSMSRNIATSPRRVLDTRVDGKPVGPRGIITLPLLGVGTVPASGVSAVVCNVTVTEPTAAGFLTVWPSGEPQPLASSLNFVRGETIPNLVVAKVGSDGAVCILNSAGSSHVVVDVVGYFS